MTPVYEFKGPSEVTCLAGWLTPGPVRTFHGRVSERGMRISFRVPNSSVTGTAVLDSGYPDLLISRAFAERAGFHLDHEAWVQVHGIGGEPVRVPTAHVQADLVADTGSNMGITWRHAAATALPEGLDMLIGLRVIACGVLTVDGPGGTWTWRVDDSKRAERGTDLPRTNGVS